MKREQDYEEERINELQALEAIYLDDLESESPSICTIKVVPDRAEEDKALVSVALTFTLTPKYPDEPPLISIESLKGLSEAQVNFLSRTLDEECQSVLGTPMIFTLVEKAREWLRDCHLQTENKQEIAFFQEMRQRREEVVAAELESWTEIRYRCFTQEDLATKLERKANRISSVLNISVARARLLLRQYCYNVDKVLLDFLNDGRGTLIRSHIIPENASSSLLPLKSSSFAVPLPPDAVTSSSCLVCDAENESLYFGGACGHRLCRGCWRDYLALKISDSNPIPCPAYKCGVLLEDERIRPLLEPATFSRYVAFQQRRFVDRSINTRWCTRPGCSNVLKMESGSKAVVRCICGNKLCFACGEEPHYPANCENVKDWRKKSEQEGETLLWIGKNTKDCPQCKHLIEKNGGCNHMRCYNCKFDFCWVCLGRWSAHNNFYRCNRFPGDEAPKKGSVSAKKTQQDRFRENLEKYRHHYERYVNHNRSAQLEQVIRERALQKMKILHRKEDRTTWQEVNYIYLAAEQLLQCRLILKWSYVFSFFLSETINKPLFEFFQEDLERTTEQLSEYLESTEDVARHLLINTTQLAERRLINLLEFVEREQKVCFNIGTFVTSSPLVASKIVKKIELKVSAEGVKTSAGDEMSMQKLLHDSSSFSAARKHTILKQILQLDPLSLIGATSHASSTDVMVAGQQLLWGVPQQNENPSSVSASATPTVLNVTKQNAEKVAIASDMDWVPRPILSLQGFKVTQVACGATHAMVLTSNGEVFLWGAKQLIPRRVVGELSTEFVTQIAAGQTSSFALTQSSKVFAWGLNARNQLGIGGIQLYHWDPVLITSLASEKIVKIAAGLQHTVFLSAEGRVFACGLERYLGRGGLAAADAPVLIEGLMHKRIVSIGCGQDYTIVQAEPTHMNRFKGETENDYMVYSFGTNRKGECAQPMHWSCPYHRTQVPFCCTSSSGQPSLIDTPMVIEQLRRIPLSQIICTKEFPVFVTADQSVMTFSLASNQLVKLPLIRNPTHITMIPSRPTAQDKRFSILAQQKFTLVAALREATVCAYQLSLGGHLQKHPDIKDIRGSSVLAWDSGLDFLAMVVQSGKRVIGADLRSILLRPEAADCTLKIGEHFSVRVHKAMLAARCPDFATKVLGQNLHSNEVQLSSQVDPSILSAFLEFLYTDAVLGIDESIGSDLLKLAEKFNLPTLANIAEEVTPVAFPPSLGDDLSRVLCLKETLADCHFVCEEVLLPAHRCILIARSPYFRSLFSAQTKESLTGTLSVRSSANIPFEAFRLFLQFLYADKLQFSDADFNERTHVVVNFTATKSLGTVRNSSEIETVEFSGGWGLLVGLLRAAEYYLVPSLQHLVEKELLQRAPLLKNDTYSEWALVILFQEVSPLLSEDAQKQLENLTSGIVFTTPSGK